MRIKILKCSDSLFWYSRSIGKVYLVHRITKNEYIVTADDGYRNIILKKDAEVMTDKRYIKILKCDNEILWYEDQIGAVYELHHETASAYYVKAGTNNDWVYKLDSMEVTY